VKAIADVEIDKKPVAEALNPIYEKLDRPAPKSTASILSSWKKAIECKLEEEDQAVVDLCKKYRLLAVVDDEDGAETPEDPAPTPAPPKKRAAKTEK